jgi:hypothetical protein
VIDTDRLTQLFRRREAGTAAPARKRSRLAVRLLAVPGTVAVVLVGIWLTGGVITNDFTLAMVLTVAWMALAGLIALGIALQSRDFRWPVFGAYAATAAAAGIYLGWSMFTEDVVNERIATVAPASMDGQRSAEAPERQNALLRAGTFESVRHAARGQARAIELAEGGRVLTLVDFEVENGPDLRVYLVAGPAKTEDAVDDFIDLGALKGNRGNQQYEIPPDVDLERYATAVIWCRAFSALFARAPLRA